MVLIRVTRKAKVVLANAKGSGGDVRTTGPKSRTVDRDGTKVRVAIGGSKRSGSGVRTVESKKTGSKKVQNRGNGDDAYSYINVNEKSSEMSGKRKKDLKTKSGSEEFDSFFMRRQVERGRESLLIL